MQTKILSNTKENIQLVANTIKNGSVAAFFTETVYGLGANALDTTAVKKIFKVKGRPGDNPLIIHLDCKEKIEKYAVVNDLARKIIKHFMPGAVTVVLQKRDSIPYEATGGLDSVAVRIPSSELARELIKACDLPICAPSANTSSKPSPTKASHVLDDLGGRIEYILDGGDCEIGLESTVLDCTGEVVKVLRHGGVGVEEIERVVENVDVTGYDGGVVKSPGQKYKHYSPNALVYWFNNGDNKELDRLKMELEDYIIIADLKTEDYARELFGVFRAADKAGVKAIICELAKDEGLGKAINNRIKKASQK